MACNLMMMTVLRYCPYTGKTVAAIEARPFPIKRAISQRMTFCHFAETAREIVSLLLVMLQPRVDQLEEDRHEEDRQHRGGDHAAHHTGSDGVLAARTRAMRQSQRHNAGDEGD